MLIRNVLLLSSVAGFIVGCSGESNSPEPVTASTQEIKETAIANLGRRFDSNAAAAESVFNDNQDVIEGTTLDVVSGGTETFPEPLDANINLESQIKEIVESTLALGEEGDAVTTRTGNLITINPDEVDLCADENEIALDDSSADCVALMKHLTVSLLATSEESGLLTYLFKEQPLIIMGYTPNTESLEINFGTISAVAEEWQMINGTEGSLDMPDVFTGSLKSTTTATNVDAGSEAGSISMEVVQAISIISEAAGSEFSMQPGTLFSMNADAATGVGGMEIDIGAIQGIFDVDDSYAQFNLSGFSAKAQVNPDAGEFVVSNFGIGRGPLSIKLDDEEALKVTMETLGFTVNEESGELRMDGNLNLTAVISDLLADDSEFLSQSLSMSLPQGSTLARLGDGSLKVGGVGPFSISLTTEDMFGGINTETVVANVNECLFDSPSTADSALPEVSVCQ